MLLFFFFFQDLFFKYTWNNFLHLQVELCVAAIVRPCAHEMRLQPGLGSQEKPHLDASQDQSLNETPSQPLVGSENSAYNLMVTHVGGSFSLVIKIKRFICYLLIHDNFVFQLFQQCHLVPRILDAWEENDNIQ